MSSRIGFAVAGAALVGLSGLGILVDSTPAFAASAPSSAEQFIADINALRAQVGVGALSESSALDSIAAGWTVQIEAAGALSHNPDLAASAPPNWRVLGENVGAGPNVADLQQAFTNSPEHYANMVNGSYNQIGVAVQIDSRGVMWVTEDYMDLPAPVPAPAPARTTAPAQTTAPARAPAVQAPAPALRAEPVQAPGVASSAAVSKSTTVGTSSPLAPASSSVRATVTSAPAASSNPPALAPSDRTTQPATGASPAGAGISTLREVPASASRARPDSADNAPINSWLAKAAIPGALLVSFVLFITRPRHPRRRPVMA